MATSETSKVARSLNTATNVALIAAAIAFIWMVFSKPTTSTEPEKAYTTGERFSIKGVNVADVTAGHATVVLYVRSSCKFCTESMPFYKTLAETAERPRLVVVGYEDEATLGKYVSDHSVKPDSVLRLDRNEPESRLRGTPTLILVNSTGRVEGAWRGRLDESQRTKVLQMIVSLARP